MISLYSFRQRDFNVVTGFHHLSNVTKVGLARSYSKVNQRSDKEILSAIAQGNVDEYRFIIGRYKRMAYATAYSILRNREDTEDALQEAFTRAFRSLNTFRGDAKFSTWLFRIIYLTALTKYKHAKSYSSVLLGDEAWKIAPDSEHNEGVNKLNTADRMKYLEAALKLLSAEDRMAITLYYLEEKSHREISEMTGWNLSVTKVRIHRARSKMDNHLNKILAGEKRSLI